MIDSHAHLEMDAFDSDRDEVIGRADAAGLSAIITVGTTVPDCEKAVEIARGYSMVYAAVGIHPHEVKGIDSRTYGALRALVQQEKKVVAIGEIGLDFFYDLSPRELQLRRFSEQLDLALELDLPVIVHDREAHAETLGILQQKRGLRGVFHCFSGDAAMARECLARGFYLSVAGPVTYRKSEQLREVARDIPPERLLVETDAPYLSPQSRRGRRNEPANVVETARFLAEIRGVAAGELERLTEENARRLFGLGEKTA